MAQVTAVCALLVVALASYLRGRRYFLVDTKGPLHAYYHVGIFGVIALLVACSTRSAGRRVLLCLAVVLVGYLTELNEWYWNGLGFEWTDVVLDALGAVAGTALGALTTELLG